MANNAQHPQFPLLLTRPAGGNARLWAGIDPQIQPYLIAVETPLVAIDPVQATLPTEGNVIFTSSHAVALAPAGQGRRAYCVGHRTTQVASQAGWAATCAGETADNLVATLIEQGTQGPLLHIGGVHTRGDVAQRLTQAGIITDHIAVYIQRNLPLTDRAIEHLRQDTPVIIPLFSPRAAAHFQASLYQPPQPPCHIVALSQAVADEIQGSPNVTLHISASPNLASICTQIKNVAVALTLG